PRALTRSAGVSRGDSVRARRRSGRARRPGCPSGHPLTATPRRRDAGAHSRTRRPLAPTLEVLVARFPRLSRLDRKPRVAPARHDDAPRLIARPPEAAAHVGHVGVASLGQHLARSLRAPARLTADDELRRARKVPL